MHPLIIFPLSIKLETSASMRKTMIVKVISAWYDKLRSHVVQMFFSSCSLFLSETLIVMLSIRKTKQACYCLYLGLRRSWSLFSVWGVWRQDEDQSLQGLLSYAVIWAFHREHKSLPATPDRPASALFLVLQMKICFRSSARKSEKQST